MNTAPTSLQLEKKVMNNSSIVNNSNERIDCLELCKIEETCACTHLHGYKKCFYDLRKLEYEDSVRYNQFRY